MLSSRLLASAAAAYLALPPAAAFYPYALEDASLLAARHEPAVSSAQDQSFAVPIRRTPTRRDNQFNVVTANDPTQSDSVAVDSDGSDFSYFSTVKFGSSDVEYYLLLDSGAANTWVMSADCTTDSCAKHSTLGPSGSSTLEVTSNTFSIAYGTGNVNGTLASDKVHVSSFSVDLTFGLADFASPEFASYPMDGILGLGRADRTDNDVTDGTLLDALAEASLIPAKLYGIHLSRNSDGLKDGELNLGAPNPDRYDGDLAWTSTIDNDRGFWEIPIDDAAYGGTQAGLTDRTAIIDTGTSYMLLPGNDAAALHKLIPQSAQNGEIFTIPCSTTQSLQLSFNNIAYNISAKDYVGRNVGGSTCQSNIIGRRTFGDKQWLVGAVFLKNVYAVFDYDNSRIGFGVKGSGSSMAETSASPTSTSAAGSTSVKSHTTINRTNLRPAAKLHAFVSRSRDPLVNLSIEHYLLQKSAPDSVVLFLYTNRPCIVIGRNQNPWLEVNLALLRRGQVDLVRRRSGGGTVFHDEGNVNWTVISPPATFTRDKHAEMVVHALRQLAVERARVNERHDIVLDQGSRASAALQADTHRTPFTVDDPAGPRPLKVSGSAYKLVRGRALHHGTCLLCSPNLTIIPQYLRSPAKPFIKAHGVESVSSPVANIGIDTSAFIQAVQREFARMYGSASAMEVGDEQLRLPELRKGYDEMRTLDWTYLQTPKFTFSVPAADPVPQENTALPAGFSPSASK
ncbi:putative aspartic-type endopeptidase protein [Neofusicoccum parvum UCRNP2]|uniref:Putative lipoate-protein ligase A n=1 Tax=Botryosphaeria parva (strain UCR-NP2) TaxID=1287680 RepID=R1G1I9_BOTPV|nr:putative aspartic-type endopeptidase protein [Neofusicoccum parvum UCRNP2]